MSSESSGSSTNSSYSSPQVTTTPENALLDQIAQYASQLAPQMMNWASNTFAQTSQITGEAVNNFFNASQQMTGLAGNMINQYNNLFAPENAQLVADANSYASPSRMATDMGMAGATQAQAGDQAIKNSEQNLLSYGIDPSAGRYASLDKAAAVQNAANVAGAENTQRMADINTGQQLRAEAVQAGSLLPSSISNAENTAIQANAGASNASLANANTGANLMGLADKYLSTAMGLKLSPVGQNSRSSGMSSNQSSSGGGGRGSGSGGGGSGGGGNGGGFGGGGGPAWMPQHTGYQSDNGVGAFPGSLGGPGIYGVGGADAQGQQQDPGTFDTGTGTIGPQTTDAIPGISDPTGLGGAGVSGVGDIFSQGETWNPVTGSQGGIDFGGTAGGFGGTTSDQQPTNYPGTNWDPNAADNQSLAGTSGSGWTDPAPQMNTDPTIWGGSGTQSPDYSYAGGDTSGGGGSYTDLSGSAPIDTSGGSYTDLSGGYAEGGAVPSTPTTGGYVNPQMSPSAGGQTDDVNAHLNAREFVMPQDVADWKGQEFFHKLIAQSRANRNAMMAQSPVGPKPAMARGGPAQFNSRRVG